MTEFRQKLGLLRLPKDSSGCRCLGHRRRVVSVDSPECRTGNPVGRPRSAEDTSYGRPHVLTEAHPVSEVHPALPGHDFEWEMEAGHGSRYPDNWCDVIDLERDAGPWPHIALPGSPTL